MFNKIYEQGIYSTDNIFYASLYGNGSSILKINESTYIMSCKSILFEFSKFLKKRYEQFKTAYSSGYTPNFYSLISAV